MKEIDESIKEKDFMQQIIDAARYKGWLVYHTYDSRRSATGFPDLVMLKDKRLIFAEIKREKGKVAEFQYQWLKALKGTNRCEVNVWKPSDWNSIMSTLKDSQ